MPALDKFFRKNPLLTRVVRVTSQFAILVRRLLLDRLSDEEAPTLIDRRDFVSYLQEYQREHPGELSELAMFGHIATNLVVGADSTSIAMRAAIYYALKTPDTMTLLQQELDSVEMSYPVSWQSCQGQKLPYLDAVIKESLRLHPPPTILSERVVGEAGLQLPDGRQLPAGTIVGMNGWVLQHCREVYGPETEKFKPARWLRGEAEGADDYAARIQKMQRATLTFGFGPRACIGKPIAMMQLYKVLPTLFGLFDVSLGPFLFP